MHMVLDMHVHVMHLWRMKLETYLLNAGISDQEFGDTIGKDRTLVSKYRRGLVTPSLDVILRIQEATEGAVTPVDFVSQPVNSHSGACSSAA